MTIFSRQAQVPRHQRNYVADPQSSLYTYNNAATHQASEKHSRDTAANRKGGRYELLTSFDDPSSETELQAEEGVSARAVGVV